MSDNIKSLPPVKVQINWWNEMKLIFLSVVSLILWIVLFITGISLLSYYSYVVWTNGFFDPEALKYAILLVIGAYFCQILDKNKILEALNIKRDLPFIPPEQIRKKK